MGATLLNKILSTFGFDVEDEELEQEEGEFGTSYNKAPVVKEEKKKGKILNLPGSFQSRMVITQPNTFDDSSEICDHLKMKKTVVVNLEYVDKDVARRIVDFLSGAVYSLDGSLQKVSSAIFVLAPFNVDVENELKTTRNGSTIFPWMK